MEVGVRIYTVAVPMNRQPIDLGYVLRQFPRFKFGMHDFEHRLRIQKFVYLLQSFDVYLGYDYSWYLRGPYCSMLAASGFALAGFYSSIPPGVRMTFSSPAVNDRFEGFKGFIDGYESDTDFLEIAASFHFLEAGGNLGRSEVLQRVVSKRPQFTEARCRDIRSYLEGSGILDNGTASKERPEGSREDDCAYGSKLECEPATFVPQVPDDMSRRPYDQGIYHMLVDSRESNEKISLVGRDVFRPHQRHPHVDEITVDDTELLVRLLRRS